MAHGGAGERAAHLGDALVVDGAMASVRRSKPSIDVDTVNVDHLVTELNGVHGDVPAHGGIIEEVVAERGGRLLGTDNLYVGRMPTDEGVQVSSGFGLLQALNHAGHTARVSVIGSIGVAVPTDGSSRKAV